ncbi:MAG: 5'-methylthioadenosine/S-adenosylhomocysteine nucleosidase [Candidatus Rokuibacteriota bacterium]
MFFNSRRTKARSAGASQYAIDRWRVDPVLVLGTCGGVASHVKTLDLVFATRTVQWDAVDHMNPRTQPFLEETAVSADLSWVRLDGLGEPVHMGVVASGDQDVTFDTAERLRKHDVLAADWESAAIALVCSLNRVRWAVLRGVTDVPGAASPDDAHHQGLDYRANTPVVMRKLLGLLPRLVTVIR